MEAIFSKENTMSYPPPSLLGLNPSENYFASIFANHGVTKPEDVMFNKPPPLIFSAPPPEIASDLSSEASDPSRNPRYKTEICRNFKERARCIYGDQCQFAHGRRELRDVVRNNKYKTKSCQKYWVVGYCAYGPRCNFLHDEDKQLSEIALREHGLLKPKERLNSWSPDTEMGFPNHLLIFRGDQDIVEPRHPLMSAPPQVSVQKCCFDSFPLPATSNDQQSSVCLETGLDSDGISSELVRKDLGSDCNSKASDSGEDTEGSGNRST